ncbi:hypothetical protein [Mycobacterium sp. 1165178.9]|uniref:hypothetical protein n=1 Tax=Mycobacterium sp. 1165178.9 TaxID=1834070 RepID=UPI0009F4CEDD|nr:hypothetical protein [Mycobacterium sp. 1165178.9]
MFSTYLGWPLLGIIPTGPCPHGEVRLYPEGHFDIYVGEPFERVVTDQIAFRESSIRRAIELASSTGWHDDQAHSRHR